MPHFIAIHKFHNDAARKTYCSDNGEPISQKAWAEFANNTKENVKCRQEFVGDDIALCHWEADSKEAVLEWIEELGVSEFISTELHEHGASVPFTINQTNYALTKNLLDYG